MQKSYEEATQLQKSQFSQVDQLWREGSLSFRKLTKQYQQRAIQLLANNFYLMEPLVGSYGQEFPNHKLTLDQWIRLWNHFIDDAITNNLSLIVVDSTNDKLAGVIISKDLATENPSFEKQFFVKDNAIYYIIQLQNALIDKVDKQKRHLFQTNKTVDIWGVAINQEYKQKKIFKSMIKAAQLLAKEEGYKYSFSYATNGRTSIVLRSLGYDEIAKINAKEIAIDGIQPFSLTEQISKFPALWLKQLN